MPFPIRFLHVRIGVQRAGVRRIGQEAQEVQQREVERKADDAAGRRKEQPRSACAAAIFNGFHAMPALWREQISSQAQRMSRTFSAGN